MPSAKITQLIINSPYSEPSHYLKYNPKTKAFSKIEGRRPTGYVIVTESSRAYDDPGVFVEISLVNLIRPRIKKWREAGYPGVTGITKRSDVISRPPDAISRRSEAIS
jgi:type III restriction enzyme